MHFFQLTPEAEIKVRESNDVIKSIVEDAKGKMEDGNLFLCKNNGCSDS